MYLSLLSSPFLNFFLFLCMSNVKSPLSVAISLYLPPLLVFSHFPPMHVNVLSVLSLSYSFPIPLSSYFSSSAWTFRIFMGRNQCKCCDTIPSSTNFLSLYLFRSPVFDLTHPLAISSPPPLTTPSPLHLSLTVDLFRFIIESTIKSHSVVQNKKTYTVTWNQDLGNADFLFCINPTSPSLLLSPLSNTHCLNVFVCPVTPPILSFSPRFSPPPPFLSLLSL